MKFLVKVFSFIILVSAIYLLGIFLVPSTTDMIGEKLWILEFNVWIRELKGGADGISEDLIQINQLGEVMSGVHSVTDKANEYIKKTQEGIETTKQVIDTKVQQVNKVADSFEKTKQSVNELQNNLSDLTTMWTGSQNTNSWTTLK